MKILIIKLGATGDVVRTTTLLHVLNGDVDWLTADKNIDLLRDIPKVKRCISWSNRNILAGGSYDLVVNLEDSIDTARMLNLVSYKDLFGAYLNSSGKLSYTENSSIWFDISIISQYGKTKADRLKLENRISYQELIFKGLGYTFAGQPYLLPHTQKSNLVGDYAIAPESGKVWPMKNWDYFDKLSELLKREGYIVNYLPQRDTLLEHIADVRGHRYLISGDSLPMHIALGSGIKCTAIFICTSPWEIYDYGLLKKIVSPKLSQYFYRRDFDEQAPRSIELDEVYEAVISHIADSNV